jgi:vacuolar-type H+-ATPase subunit C/Vma6
MNSSAKYGFIATRCKAMYGRCLTSDDLKRLSAMKSVQEIASFLRVHPGWKDAVAPLPPDVHRGALEQALDVQLRSEFISICRSASSDDKKFLLYPIYRMDYEQILLALRRLGSSGHLLPENVAIPDFYKKKSAVDYDGLSKCRDYPELLSCIRGSIYYDNLRGMQISESSGIPDYTEANTLLLSAYFAAMAKLSKDFKGQSQKEIREYFGQETDMLNIVHFLRLKRYFPDASQWEQIMIKPVYKVKESFLQSLISAPDYDSAYELVRKTRYGKYFGDGITYAEQGHLRWLYDYAHRYMTSGASSLLTPVAYLTIKELELKNLKNIIECVRYQMPASSAPLALSI